MNIYRIVTCLVVRSLPRAVREQAFKRLLGWEVHESAKIGFSIIDAERVSLGPQRPSREF